MKILPKLPKEKSIRIQCFECMMLFRKHGLRNFCWIKKKQLSVEELQKGCEYVKGLQKRCESVHKRFEQMEKIYRIIESSKRERGRSYSFPPAHLEPNSKKEQPVEKARQYRV